MRAMDTVITSSITPAGEYCLDSRPTNVGDMVDGVPLAASAKAIAATLRAPIGRIAVLKQTPSPIDIPYFVFWARYGPLQKTPGSYYHGGA